MMKKLTVIILAAFFAIQLSAQTEDEKGVERALLDYLEGFYEGDTTKLIRGLHPNLSKYGFWMDKKSGEYRGSAMSFEAAKNYAKKVKEKGNFPDADAPKEIEIYEVQDKTACGKVTAWWGTDYMLLAKVDEGWQITHVLWQSQPEDK